MCKRIIEMSTNPYVLLYNRQNITRIFSYNDYLVFQNSCTELINPSLVLSITNLNIRGISKVFKNVTRNHRIRHVMLYGSFVFVDEHQLHKSSK